MTWHLATDANIRLLPLHEQLFAFAYSYLEASRTLCMEAIRHAEELDWSRGAVVLLNAAHAVELFLKGVLVRKAPDFDIWKYGHDIHALATEYDKLYSEPGHAWNIPFRRALPDDLPPAHLRLIREGMAHPSIEFRYPVNKQGTSWMTLQGFEPNSYLRELDRLRDDFDRIYRGAA